MKYTIIEQSQIPERTNRAGKWTGILDELPVEKAAKFEFPDKHLATLAAMSMGQTIRNRKSYKIHTRTVQDGKITYLYVWKVNIKE